MSGKLLLSPDGATAPSGSWAQVFPGGDNRPVQILRVRNLDSSNNLKVTVDGDRDGPVGTPKRTYTIPAGESDWLPGQFWLHALQVSGVSGTVAYSIAVEQG